MRFTVIFDDGALIKDGKAILGADLIRSDANHRVIQWYDDHGVIEVYEGDRIWLDNIEQVQPYIDQYEALSTA
jgi:hypothetical protein